MGRHRVDDDEQEAPHPPEPRRRRGKGGAIAALAGAVAVLLGLGVTGWVVLSDRSGCGGQDLRLDVAAAPGIAPVLTQIASTFNAAGHGIDGRCVEVSVRGEEPANIAHGITGSGPTTGDTDSHIWIPDSSLWADAVTPTAPDAVTTTGTSVASSPLVIASQAKPLEEADISLDDLSWKDLMPSGQGSPSAGESSPFSFRLLDPLRYAEGLATLTLIRSALGDDENATTKLTGALRAIQDGVASDTEAAFEDLAAEPAGKPWLIPLAEQSVWRFNSEHPEAPLAVGYPEGGTHTLDYPYLLRTDDPQLTQASKQFRTAVMSDKSQRLLRGEGFRSEGGKADSGVLSKKAGFQATAPENLPTPSASVIQEVSAAWTKLKLDTRLITVLDVSGSMALTVPGTGLTRMRVATKAAREGLTLFPGNSKLGLWEFSTRINNDLDYRVSVPVRQLDQQVEGQTQLEAIDQALASAVPVPDGDTGLYDSTLAAYREAVRTYEPDKVNTVLVLTDGVNDDEDSISLDKLVSTLESESPPDKPVQILFIAFGPDIDAGPLEKIAGATGGKAYSTDDPTKIGKIFLKSIALRLASAGQQGE